MGSGVSAGSHPISLIQPLLGGLERRSNLLVGSLMPELATATPAGLIAVAGGKVMGNIDLTGTLMGTDADDVFVGLYRDGAVVQLISKFKEDPPALPPPDPQNAKPVVIEEQTAVPVGEYLVILRVNGIQAKNAPLVDLTP